MKLRPYNPDDFEGLYLVEERCFDVPLRFDREYMLKLLTRRSSFAFVVEEQKVIVAFAIASIHKKAEQIYAYIETLEVLDGFRGRGMARLLIAELEASARGSHAAMVLLHVDCSNERAVRLYEKNGYEKVDEQEEFYPGGNTAFIYLKSLFEE